jgi:hypothetical protein
MSTIVLGQYADPAFTLPPERPETDVRWKIPFSLHAVCTGVWQSATAGLNLPAKAVRELNRHPCMSMKPARVALLAIAVLSSIVLLVPENAGIPVQGASTKDWNRQSFWYEPWGSSGVHKGIDIFAPEGRPVFSPVHGLVIYRGDFGIGGHVVAVLGPRFHVHYFAHLSSWRDGIYFVSRGEELGKVGTSGNAAGKPPHLHYAIVSLFPRPWRFSAASQGWKRMFFLDPNGVVGGASQADRRF